MPPKERKDWYDGEHRRLQIAQQQGLLVEAEAVREKLADVYSRIRTFFQTLADVLERDVGLEPEQVQRAIDTGDRLLLELQGRLVEEVD